MTYLKPSAIALLGGALALAGCGDRKEDCAAYAIDLVAAVTVLEEGGALGRSDQSKVDTALLYGSVVCTLAGDRTFTDAVAEYEEAKRHRDARARGEIIVPAPGSPEEARFDEALDDFSW